MKTVEWTNEFCKRFNELINADWVVVDSTYELKNDKPSMARLQKRDPSGIMETFILVEEEVKEKKVDLYNLKDGDVVWTIRENNKIMKYELKYGICLKNIKDNVKNGNGFSTELDVKIELQKRQVEHELKKFAFKPDWNNDKQAKWVICYCCADNNIIFSEWLVCKYGFIYFKSQEIAEQAIKEVGEERVKAYLKGELYE